MSVPTPALTRLRTLVHATMALLVVGCGPPPRTLWNTAKPAIEAASDVAPFERQMFARLNADRRKAGLPALRYDDALAAVARAHSDDMRRHRFFAHESPTTGVLEDRMDRAGYLATEMRENLAKAPNVQRAEDNLLKSPGHRRNILADTVSHVGIGIVRASSDNRVLLITQVFAQRAALTTPEQTVSGVRRAVTHARRRAGLPPLSTHAMLTELASAHVDALPDGVPSDAVSDIGTEVSQVLNERDDHALHSVQILAQSVFNADEFSLPETVLGGRAASIGIAARPSKDERGRPRIKVLALVGLR